MIKTLQATDNEFLADHIIGDNQVLPTVCAMAWMADAAESIASGYHYIGLKNYKLYKGIVFDGTQSSDYLIDLNNLNTDDQNSLTLDVKISSNNHNGKPVYHYAAQILLGREKSTVPEVSTLQHIDTKMHDDHHYTEQATALYNNGTLFHGESLQGIRELVQCDEKGLLLACRVPEIAQTKAGQFPLSSHNIFANDLVYQALLVWVREQLAMGSLPSSTAEWTTYRQVKLGEMFYLQLSIIESSNSKVIADIALISADNRLLADIKSAEVTVSENLNNLFVDSSQKVSGL